MKSENVIDLGQVKVLLIAVQRPEVSDEQLELSLAELGELVITAGGTVVGMVVQRRHKPDRTNYLGPGKLEEAASIAKDLGAVQLISDDELSALQLRRIEESTGMIVVDRTLLIIEIFAQHASTREGKLQVELARLQYRLIRLAGGYTGMSRQRGGIGTKGPGEAKIETDRRVVKNRIRKLHEELEKVTISREVQRSRRSEIFAPLFAMAGYTNAGKSSLLNSLCGSSEVAVHDGLFTTLDPTARKIALPGGRTAVLSDTVGFIRKLPHGLVKAFRATLESVITSQVIVVVCDVSDPSVKDHIDAVDAVLAEIGVSGKERIIVFNKIDKASPGAVELMRAAYPESITVSARERLNLDLLREAFSRVMMRSHAIVKVCLPSKSALLKEIFSWGRVISQEWEAENINLIVELPERLIERLNQELPGSVAESR